MSSSNRLQFVGFASLLAVVALLSTATTTIAASAFVVGNTGSSFRRTVIFAKPKVFIDGEAGTTGLQVRERLASRDDLQVISIDDDKRKDEAERKRLINEADAVILCTLLVPACNSIPTEEGTNPRKTLSRILPADSCLGG
jgi:N-acetyl-gamma-glutamyl-phosphate reductase